MIDSKYKQLHDLVIGLILAIAKAHNCALGPQNFLAAERMAYAVV